MIFRLICLWEITLSFSWGLDFSSYESSFDRDQESQEWRNIFFLYIFPYKGNVLRIGNILLFLLFQKILYNKEKDLRRYDMEREG